MYEVKFSQNGIVHTIKVGANDAVEVHNILTNMFGNGQIQIIDIKRI